MAIEVQYLKETDFDTAVTGKTALIDFFATWCGPCKVLGKAINALALEAPDGTVIGKVDIAESPALAAKYQVSSIPTVIILKNGECVFRKTGSMDKNELLTALRQFAV